jgi:hypothetical protein
MAKINKWGTIAAILILVLSCGMLFVPAHTALALIDTVYVNGDTGNDGWDGSSPINTDPGVGPVKTIAKGFSLVSTGGIVNVAAWTYTENLVFNRSFTLMGPGDGATSTIIDGGEGDCVLCVSGGSNISIGAFTIQNGKASEAAGGLGVYSGSTVSVNDCVIKDNVGRDGGGVGVYPGGWLGMVNCAITGNGGGGIHNDGGTADLTNCTISGNTASSSAYWVGGGIRNLGTSYAAMTLTNCTVVDNHATGSPGQGGGFYNDNYSTITFKNTIVANNTAVSGNNGYNNGGTVTSQGYNLDSEDSCGFNQLTDKINTDPLLGPLQGNGGPKYTLTHALLSGSPAIDAGTSDGAPATDQRGVARPKREAYDIGAYELDVIPDVVDDYSIKGSIKFFGWTGAKGIVIKEGQLRITYQGDDPHEIEGYFELPAGSIEGWPDSVPVEGYVGPLVYAKGKVKNTPRLSLLGEFGDYAPYVICIINGKIKWDKKTDTVKSIKCTINGYGSFGSDDPDDIGKPRSGQFEGKFTATPIP